MKKKKLTPEQLAKFKKLHDEHLAIASTTGVKAPEMKKFFAKWSQLEKKVGRKVSHGEIAIPHSADEHKKLAKKYLENAFYGLRKNGDEMPDYFERPVFLNAVIIFLQEQLLEWHNINNTKGIEYNDNGKSITMVIKNGKSKTVIKSPIVKDVTGEKITIEVID